MGVSRLLVGEGPPTLWSSQRDHRPGLPRSPLLPTRGRSAGISAGNQRVGLLELVMAGSRGLGGVMSRTTPSQRKEADGKGRISAPSHESPLPPTAARC